MELRQKKRECDHLSSPLGPSHHDRCLFAKANRLLNLHLPSSSPSSILHLFAVYRFGFALTGVLLAVFMQIFEKVMQPYLGRGEAADSTDGDDAADADAAAGAAGDEAGGEDEEKGRVTVAGCAWQGTMSAAGCAVQGIFTLQGPKDIGAQVRGERRRGRAREEERGRKKEEGRGRKRGKERGRDGTIHGCTVLCISGMLHCDRYVRNTMI